MNRALFLAGAFALALLSGHVHARSPEEILQSLDFQKGTVTLSNGLAKIQLTENFSYLDAKDTETFLVELWGNPPDVSKDTLGTIVPNDTGLADAEGWAVILTYDASGYVSDEDAGQINYTELLTQMQEETRQGNEERTKQGYEPIELVGWAREPYYDAQAKKLYWAKRLRFGQAEEDTLNYEIRVLGRAGVLDLNVVALMSSLPMVDRRAPEILSMVSFNTGHTYAEFDPEVDQVAAYGLAGLIAGGVLAKVGFFKGILLFILAFKKAFIFGAIALVAALGGFFKKLFAQRSAAK
jgi:uncharacterized membrane-anchored protein